MIRASGLMIGLCCASTFALPPAPVADPSGMPKNRYLSMSVPSNGGEPTALRVTLSSLHHPDPSYLVGTAADFTAFEGEYRWVGPPVFASEYDYDAVPFVAAQLQCTPYYHDWSALGLFHVYGDAVVPSSAYEIIAFAQSCLGTEDGCAEVSQALQIVTSRYGDVATPFNPPSTSTQPDIADGGSMFNHLRHTPGSPKKDRSQLLPDIVNPQRNVNVLDFTAVNDGVGGRGYPGTGPTACGLSVAGVESVSNVGGDNQAIRRVVATTRILLTPIPSQGTGSYPGGSQISGQQLSAPTGGFRAFLHAQIQNWDPGHVEPPIRAYQIQLDAESLLGINASPPAPGIDLVLAQESCPSGAEGHAYCLATFGETEPNFVPACFANSCSPVIVDILRSDWLLGVTESRNGLILNLSPAGPIVAGFVFNTGVYPVDDGNRWYLGTIVLDVPTEAIGHVYTIKVLSGDDTVIVSGLQPPAESPIAETIAATIKIGTPADATGINRCRFISFVPGHSGEQMAIRVKLVSLHHVDPPYTNGPSIPFASFEGEYRWVGPPTQYAESTASAVPFYAATLQCDPHYQDWSTAGYMHVTGSAIVPSSQYEVQFVPASCMGSEDTCTEISAPLLRETTRWGDVETNFNPPSTTTQPDLTDIAALVNKFRSAPGAPIKARAMLAGSDASGNIDLAADLSFAHISACVDAFRGRPYPHAGPESCE